MRITFVSALWLPYTGGLEVVTGQMLKELQYRGHDVAVVTSRDDATLPRRETVNGIEVIRSDAHAAIASRDPSWILREQRSTWDSVRELQPDVLHAHDGSPSLWMYLRAARTRRPPLLLSLHIIMTRHFALRGASLAGLRTMLRAADHVTAVSEPVLDDALGFEPTFADRSSVVPNGIDPPTRPWREIEDRSDRLLCIGRLAPEKNLGRALHVVRLLVDRRPSIRLTVAGDGPEREHLTALAHRLGVDDRVDFLGAVPHDRITDLIEDATVVVMPSQFEGMPLVALEAAWAGRPVVAAAVPGLDTTVIDGVTGRLVDGDDEALADAVEEVLADRQWARRMGAAARAHAEAAFSISRCVDEYEAIYEALVLRTPPAN